QLASDPRLSLARRSRLRSVRAIAGALMRAGVPHSALRVVRSPDVTRARYVRELEEFARIDLPEDATSEQRLDAFERLILTATRHAAPALAVRPKVIPRPLRLSIDRRDRHRRRALVRKPGAHPWRARELLAPRRRRAGARRTVREGPAGGGSDDRLPADQGAWA